jgi:hypothetical protein
MIKTSDFFKKKLKHEKFDLIRFYFDKFHGFVFNFFFSNKKPTSEENFFVAEIIINEKDY